MKNASEFTYWIAVIPIAIIAIGLIGVTWINKTHDKSPAEVPIANNDVNRNYAVNVNTNTTTVTDPQDQEHEVATVELSNQNTSNDNQNINSINSNPNNVNNTNEENVSRCPPPPDTSETWATYTNSEFGYTIRYPREYRVITYDASVSFDNDVSAIPMLNLSYPSRTKRDEPFQDLTLEEWTKTKYMNPIADTFEGIKTVDGREATIVYSHIYPTGTMYEQYIINNSGELIVMAAAHFDEEDKCQDWILDAFFSSFHFTDNSSVGN